MKAMAVIKGIGITALNVAKEKSPAILLGLSVAAGIGAVLAMRKAAPKEKEILAERDEAIKKLDEEKPETETEETIKEYKTKKRAINLETTGKLVKIYIPVIICTTLMAGCAFSSHHVSMRRTAALQVAYDLTRNKLEDQTKKIKEMLGPKKSTTVHDKIMEDKVATNPPNGNSIIFTGGGNVICYDEYSGRYFHSDPETIRRAVNNLNERLRTEMYISLNEFYQELNIGTVRMGDDLGWNIDRGNIDISFTSMLTTEARPGIPINTPVLALDYDVQPRFNYFGD